MQLQLYMPGNQCEVRPAGLGAPETSERTPFARRALLRTSCALAMQNIEKKLVSTGNIFAKKWLLSNENHFACAPRWGVRANV